MVLGANERGDAVAQALGQVKPSGVVPRANQPLPPFLGHHLGGTRSCSFWHHPQRVPVKVDHAFRNGEQRFERTQWVSRVTLLAVLESDHGRRLVCSLVLPTQQQILHQCFLDMHAVFGFVPDHTLRAIDHFSLYLFPAMRRKAVHK